MSLLLPGDPAMMQRMQNPMIQGLLQETEKHKQISGYLEKLLIEALITLEKLNNVIQDKIPDPPQVQVSDQLVQWWTQVRPQVMKAVEAQQQALKATETPQIVS